MAAVNCGGDTGEAINIYTKAGVFGGTFWTMDEHAGEHFRNPASAILPVDQRVQTGIGAAFPEQGVRSSHTPATTRLFPHDANATGQPGSDPGDGPHRPTDNRIVALVHLQWLDNDPPDGPQETHKAARTDHPRSATVTEQVVNVYDKFGHFHGTVISEAEAERGKAYLNSPKFDLKRDMSDLCYSALSAN